MLNRDRASLLFAAVFLALVLGGIGLYASTNDPKVCDGFAGRCHGEDTFLLNSDGAVMWWYAAAAVLVLGLLALPLVGRSTEAQTSLS